MIAVTTLFLTSFLVGDVETVDRRIEPAATLRSQLEVARREHDDEALARLQKVLLERARNLQRADYTLSLAVAEAHLFRADFRRLDRTIRELDSDTVSRYRSQQAEWGRTALPYAERAVALAKDTAEHAQAERVLGELYVHQINGPLAGLAKGPKALRHIQSAVALAPHDPECNRAIGLMYLYNPPINGGDVARAVRTFRSCTRWRPEDDRYQLYLALAFRKKGKRLLAEVSARKALSLNEKNVDAKHLVDALLAERSEK